MYIYIYEYIYIYIYIYIYFFTYIYIYVSELADGRSGGIRQVSGVLKETPGGIREFLWEEAIGSLTEVSGRHARHPGYTMW